MAIVLLLCGVGALAGYWLGRSTADLDGTYITSMERLSISNGGNIEQLQAQLVEAELAREVEREAAQTLKNSIRELRDQVAALSEEVTFYKSLMAPSSVAKGLQIADFEVLAMEQEGSFTFHLLLTQVESRRDWVQGDADLEVHGRMTGSESTTAATDQVLPLTEIAADGTYPLKFRFRYFQDLTGMITLPQGFEPERIIVTAGKRGASSESLNRTFEWQVSG